MMERQEAPETDIARDIVRRSIAVVPLVLLFGLFVAGFAGALSAGYALVLVLANFLLAASLLAWAAKISPALLMAAALGGFILRLILIAVAVLLIRNFWFFEPWPLGITIIVAHLGLLAWETRYISLSLAHPGLAPRAAKKSGGNC
jgi:hypothetical protein